MQLLLDTHTFLWWAADDPQLSSAARAAIASAGNDVFASLESGRNSNFYAWTEACL